MATGFQNSAGVDFDDLFDPYVTGTKPAATSLQTSDGVDLRDRYAPLAFGSKGPDVGIQNIVGVDVSNLWAGKGTAQYAISGLHGKALQAEGQAPTSGVNALAVVSVSLSNDGSWLVTGSNHFGSVAQPQPVSGSWLRPGTVPADYDFRMRVTSTGDATATNSASTWRQASTGGAATASISVSVPGASTARLTAAMTVYIDLRDRATGSVSTTTLSGTVTATGFV